MEKAASVFGFSTSDYNLRALEANSEILAILRDSFAQMLDKEAFFITSFQESQSYKALKGFDSKVYREASKTEFLAEDDIDCRERFIRARP